MIDDSEKRNGLLNLDLELQSPHVSERHSKRPVIKVPKLLLI